MEVLEPVLQVTITNTAKRLIEMSLGVVNRVDPRNHYIRAPPRKYSWSESDYCGLTEGVWDEVTCSEQLDKQHVGVVRIQPSRLQPVSHVYCYVHSAGLTWVLLIWCCSIRPIPKIGPLKTDIFICWLQENNVKLEPPKGINPYMAGSTCPPNIYEGGKSMVMSPPNILEVISFKL